MNRLLAIAGDSGLSNSFELGEELLAVTNRMLCTTSEAVDLKHTIRQRSVLECRDGFAHSGLHARRLAIGFFRQFAQLREPRNNRFLFAEVDDESLARSAAGFPKELVAFDKRLAE